MSKVRRPAPSASRFVEYGTLAGEPCVDGLQAHGEKAHAIGPDQGADRAAHEQSAHRHQAGGEAVEHGAQCKHAHSDDGSGTA